MSTERCEACRFWGDDEIRTCVDDSRYAPCHFGGFAFENHGCPQHQPRPIGEEE